MGRAQRAYESKRKRVYTNRTKTGCLTCRRRKKKCDEERPTCNNCVYAGLFCEGYSTGRIWQKSSTRASTADRDSAIIPSIDDRPSTSATTPESNAPTPDRSLTPQSRNGSHPHEPFQDEIHPPQPPQNGVHSRQSRQNGVYSRQPSQNVGSYQSSIYMPTTEGGPPRRAVQPSSIVTASSEGQIYAESPPGYVDTNGLPAAQARLTLNLSLEPHVIAALEHQRHQQQMARANHQVAPNKPEQMKMIDGEPYHPHDVQLLRDREVCQAALWRYTNSQSPLNGISYEERIRLLRRIFQPATCPSDSAPQQAPNTQFYPPASAVPTPSVAAVSASDQSSPKHTPPPSFPLPAVNAAAPVGHPIGGIGTGSFIDPPFNCHYGYNIQIGSDVHISRNCLFVDDCMITIGSHTWIGPGLTIVTSTALRPFCERKGTKSSYQGRSVVIEDHCWIGPNVTLMPGAHIGKGVSIEAGLTVATSIPAYVRHGAPTQV